MTLVRKFLVEMRKMLGLLSRSSIEEWAAPKSKASIWLTITDQCDLSSLMSSVSHQAAWYYQVDSLNWYSRCTRDIVGSCNSINWMQIYILAVLLLDHLSSLRGGLQQGHVLLQLISNVAAFLRLVRALADDRYRWWVLIIQVIQTSPANRFVSQFERRCR